MPALYAGKRVGKPLMGGHTYNAMFNGKLVWPLDRDTVVSIRITDDSGKPIDNITLRVGESKNLKVTILPDAASQEFAASAARPDIAVVGDAKPTGITVSPESLTLRVGETASLNVNILPDYAPQEYTASIKDVSLASVRQQ